MLFLRIAPGQLIKSIHWNFIAGSALLILYSLATVADFLQGGYLWPLCLGAAVAQAVVLWRGW